MIHMEFTGKHSGYRGQTALVRPIPDKEWPMLDHNTHVLAQFDNSRDWLPCRKIDFRPVNRQKSPLEIQNA